MIFFCVLIIILIFITFSKEKEHINFNAKYMLSQYPKYNLDYDIKNKKFIHKISKGILSTNNQFNSRISAYISNNKEKTLKKLKENQIPVTKFYLWDKDLDISENLNLIKISKINYPIVAKPTNGTQGRDVITDINDIDQLVNTIPKFRKNDKILIEEQVTGKNYRILVFNGKIIDIIERIPPIVKGDGVNTLEKLIEIYGETQRKKGFYGVHNYDINLMKSQGYDINDIIPLNKKILLTKTVNFHNGSQLKRIKIQNIHPLNVRMFTKINKILNLDLSGIDYMANSLEIPFYVHGSVIEVNSGPDMKIHYKADSNEKNYAVSRFLNSIEKIII